MIYALPTIPTAPEVTAGQIHLLFVAVAFYALACGLSWARVWSGRDARRDAADTDADSARRARRDDTLRVASKACQYAGLLVGLGVLVWHSSGRGSWRPLEDNFEALIWLGLLLSLFVLYTQRTHPLRGLDVFVLPIVVLLLVGAGVFGRATPHEYDASSVWIAVHILTVLVGAAGFAVAGAVGAMYLVVDRRLRAKPPLPGPNFGSLERLEHLTLTAVTLGFSLLTVGAITGMLAMLREGKQTPTYKFALTAGVWLVYAVVLHSPINPSFRGRKAAVLSVVGFVLVAGTLVAVNVMPK